MSVPLALVFDSDPAVRARTAEALRAAGLEIVEATTSQDVLEGFRVRPVAIAVLGFASERDALNDLLAGGLRLRPTAVIAVMDGGGAARAAEVVRAGAFELLPRPADRDRLVAFALRAVAQHTLLEELRLLRAVRGMDASSRLTGRSKAIEGVRRRIASLVEPAHPVLFVGEPGSGRRNAAQALHALRGRAVELLEALAPDTERRLFDARAEAGRGVHLAGLEQLAWPAQERLAAALAEGTLSRHLTASALRPPAELARDGLLAEGLRDAFGTAIVALPALRERREDIALLARAFIEGLRELNALPPIRLDADAVDVLENWPWTENVLELRNAVETAVILASDGRMRAGDLMAVLRAGPAGDTPAVRSDRRFREAKKAVVEAFERAYLNDLLRRSGGNVTGAAHLSGMLRSALQRLLRKHDLRSTEFREPAADGSRHGAD
jgi:DNA-binding NtrC family response regulator